MTRSIFAGVALVALFAGADSFALGKTDCSNADGSVTRVEEEIWGANPVKYVVNGQENLAADVNASFKQKRVLERTGDRRASTETYAAQLVLTRKDGGMVGPGAGGREVGLMKLVEWVICRSWQNDARD